MLFIYLISRVQVSTWYEAGCYRATRTFELKLTIAVAISGAVWEFLKLGLNVDHQPIHIKNS